MTDVPPADTPAVDEAYDALATDVLSDMDPAADPFWPGITELDESGRPDAFPPDWGEQGPTERDQAAIDAGNAPAATDEEVLG